MGRARVEDRLEAEYGMPVGALLYHLHHEELMTVQNIAKKLNCSRPAINRTMERHGIQRRTQGESLVLWWQNVTDEQKKARVKAAHEKNKELAEQGDHSFQRVWREDPERMREQVARNALKTCRIRKRNGMTGKTGEKNHRWDAKRTKENRIKFRKTTEGYAWVRAVYEKDNYICQACGYDKGGTLNAHHLNSYADCEKLRHEVSNGITLCGTCHREFHTQYGWGKNTKEQFGQFVAGGDSSA